MLGCVLATAVHKAMFEKWDDGKPVELNDAIKQCTDEEDVNG